MDEESNIHQQEQELLDSVKGFLALYLNQILDDPDQLIKLAIQERDEEIKALKKELEGLKIELAQLRASINITEDSDNLKAMLGGLNIGLNRSIWTSTPSTGSDLSDLFI